MEKGGWVYIMANRYRGGMYVGVTSDAIGRLYQHREGKGSQHVRDFGKRRLVYVERHETIEGAIAREKLVKKWRREWKFALNDAGNPDWDDLWEQCSHPRPSRSSRAPCQARGDGDDMAAMGSVSERQLFSRTLPKRTSFLPFSL